MRGRCVVIHTLFLHYSYIILTPNSHRCHGFDSDVRSVIYEILIPIHADRQFIKYTAGNEVHKILFAKYIDYIRILQNDISSVRRILTIMQFGVKIKLNGQTGLRQYRSVSRLIKNKRGG